MSLLLTFFIMLVSFSELKSEDNYQSLMDVFQEQFGNQDSQVEIQPGQLRPRNSALSKLAAASRLKRTNAGGRVASCHVSPRSLDRKTVGPRCPVLDAIKSVRRSRASWTTCWMI